MPRKVHIVTTSGFNYYSTIEENRDRALRYVESAGRRGADLVCLPETFLGIDNLGAVETLTGDSFAAISQMARRYGVWVVAGSLLVSPDDGRKFNQAIVIDRAGVVVGSYAKVHPMIKECEDRDITPGSNAVVIDTDFGRLGLAICFDIGWPSHWSDLARQGAELVVWPSAYDGGFPLQCYAWLHRYYVVSSVLTARANVFDITGTVLATTSDWAPLADLTIDLEKELLDADENEEKLTQVADDLGDKVSIVTFDQERYLTLESNDAEWPVARIKSKYGLESFADYYARSAGVQDHYRAMTKKSIQV